jgi:hypothetical protein
VPKAVADRVAAAAEKRQAKRRTPGLAAARDAKKQKKSGCRGDVSRRMHLRPMMYGH